MGHWVKFFAVRDSCILSSLFQREKYASWAQGDAFSQQSYQSTVPEHHWSHLISQLNLFMTSLRALLLFQSKGKLFTVREVKPWISCGMSIFGDFWKPEAQDSEQAGLTLKLALCSAGEWTNWSRRSLPAWIILSLHDYPFLLELCRNGASWC